MLIDTPGDAVSGEMIVRRVSLRSGAFVGIKIFVDGELAGSVGNRGELRVRLPAGEHVVQAELQGARSVPVSVNVEAQERVVLETEAPRINLMRWSIPTPTLPRPTALVLRVVREVTTSPDRSPRA